MLLELFSGRRKKGTASLFLLLVWCLNLTGVQPFAWVPRGVYIGLPLGGTMVIRLGAGLAVCDCARRLLRRLLGPADWWVPPAARSLVDRQAPLPRAWSAAGHCGFILLT